MTWVTALCGNLEEKHWEVNMTYEEAKAYFEMRLIDNRTRQREAFRIALECIESQLPHPVNGDAYCWSCPTCGNEYEMTEERPKHCDECGQAFDFSDIPDWDDIDWGDD